MDSDDLIYRKLQKHLDRMPVGFPESRTGNDLKILKGLFTPEQAEIALELSMLPETASRIYPRLKKKFSSIEELEVKLDEMFNSGLIMGGKFFSNDDKKKLFSNAQYVIGIHEFQVNRIKKEIAPFTRSYVENDFADAFLKEGVPAQMRTIPIQKGILRENFTATYDNIQELIKNTTGRIVITNCVCRQIGDASGNGCKLSDVRETCIFLKRVAENAIDSGNGRIIEKEEALSLVRSFEKLGFVIQPENNMEPEFICFCCGCCCGVLNGLKNMQKPAERYNSHYNASVNSQKCTGCGLCITRCQMNALCLSDKKAVIDLNRCIGCGLCTSVCRPGAIALETKNNYAYPPKNHNELYQKILLKKIGTAAAIKTLLKYKLGFKV